jgi:hypothetical protein
MRINEILTESQLQQLDEGPIGSALGAVGRGVGKAVGGVAKGVGAVAGGAVGAFNALKKGFQTGKAVVGDDPDPNAGAPGYTAPVEPAARTANTAAAPAVGGAAPASGPAPGSVATPGSTPATPASSTTPPSAAEINAQGPAGTAPAKSQTGAAGQALAKSTAVVDKQQAQSQEKANQTVYAQVKANVDKLDKKGKQRILQLLQKSVAAPAPKAPAAAPGAAAPAADPAAAGAGAMGQMAKQLAGEKPNTMANAPVSKTNVAKPGNPNAPAAAPAADPAAAPATKARGGKVAGAGPSQTPDAIRKREARAAAAAKAKAGNAAMGNMVNTLQQQNASKDHRGNALAEALAHRVEFHKQKMFETGLSRGSISVFRK